MCIIIALRVETGKDGRYSYNREISEDYMLFNSVFVADTKYDNLFT